MKLQYIAISVLVVSMVMLGMITFISDLGVNYGETADMGGLNETQERFDAMYNTSLELEQKVTDFALSTDDNVLLIPYKFFQVGWNGAKLVFNSWGVMFGIIYDSGSIFESTTGKALPPWLISGIISILLIIISMIIIFAFFKWKFSD